MALSGRAAETIGGITIPRRRFTRWAVLYFLGLFVAPLLTVCFLIDLLLYHVVTDLLGHCYAVFCWFQ